MMSNVNKQLSLGIAAAMLLPFAPVNDAVAAEPAPYRHYQKRPVAGPCNIPSVDSNGRSIGAAAAAVLEVQQADDVAARKAPRVISRQDWLTNGSVAGTLVEVDIAVASDSAKNVACNYHAKVQQQVVPTGDSYIGYITNGVLALGVAAGGAGSVMEGKAALNQVGKLGTNITNYGSSASASGGAGGNSTANATGGAGGNATSKATGGSSTANSYGGSVTANLSATSSSNAVAKNTNTNQNNNYNSNTNNNFNKNTNQNTNWQSQNQNQQQYQQQAQRQKMWKKSHKGSLQGCGCGENS